jgi:hypothetical protein
MADVFNRFFVGAVAEDIAFMLPIPQRMSKAEALNLAAWIVALADPTREKFDALHKVVIND